MKFTHYDLGYLRGGEVVEVSLKGSAANVRLLDGANYKSFKAGSKHRFYGGHAKRSPVRIHVPRAGHWHLTVDLGGYSGSVRSGIRVLPGPLKPLREQPLSSVPSLVQDDADIVLDADHGEPFDVFISHASEDKDAVVRPLAKALVEAGLKVWFDEFELRIGDSLRRTIDKGLANSRFGIVVLSQHFFDKGWANYELDGLVTRTVTGEQVLLPIWHNVSKDEVMRFSPSLADKLARSTATHTINEIADEISELIQGGGDESS